MKDPVIPGDVFTAENGRRIVHHLDREKNEVTVCHFSNGKLVFESGPFLGIKVDLPANAGFVPAEGQRVRMNGTPGPIMTVEKVDSDKKKAHVTWAIRQGGKKGTHTEELSFSQLVRYGKG